jgi:Recombination endonuclease VII
MALSHTKQLVPTRQCADCPQWLPAGSKKQRCEPCALTRLRGQRQEAKVRWAVANPEANKVIQHRGQFKHKYGVTPEQAQVVLEDQGGICAMRGCDREAIRVDHCHDTGVFRGWLCHGCNVRLSGIEDTEFLAAAIEYLDQRRDGVVEVAIRKHGEGEVIPDAQQKTGGMSKEAAAELQAENDAADSGD